MRGAAGERRPPFFGVRRSFGRDHNQSVQPLDSANAAAEMFRIRVHMREADAATGRRQTGQPQAIAKPGQSIGGAPARRDGGKAMVVDLEVCMIQESSRGRLRGGCGRTAAETNCGFPVVAYSGEASFFRKPAGGGQGNSPSRSRSRRDHIRPEPLRIPGSTGRGRDGPAGREKNEVRPGTGGRRASPRSWRCPESARLFRAQRGGDFRIPAAAPPGSIPRSAGSCPAWADGTARGRRHGPRRWLPARSCLVPPHLQQRAGVVSISEGHAAASDDILLVHGVDDPVVKAHARAAPQDFMPPKAPGNA